MQRGRGRQERGRGRGREERGRGRGREERGRGRGLQEGGRGRGRGRGNQPFGWMTLEEGQRRQRDALTNGRISSSEITKFGDLTPGKFAPRPDSGGTIGRKFKILTNCYKLSCNLPKIYHYDVQITQHGRKLLRGDEEETQERMPAKLNRAILSECAAQYKWTKAWAFDGQKSLYTPEHLFDVETVTLVADLSETGRERKFDIKISLAATLSVYEVQRYLQTGSIGAPLKIISALEVCIKAAFVNDARCLCYARSFFFHNQQAKQTISGGAELWQGHIQSIRLAESGLMLNLDVAHAAFFKEQPVIDYLVELTNKRNINDLKRFTEKDWKRLGRELKSVDVVTTHLQTRNKKHRCGGFTTQSAESVTFLMKREGEKLNVASYWASKYGPLKFPWLPCIDASKGKKLNYLPLEVCRIAGNQRKGNLTPDQTRDLIRRSARKPSERLNGIREALRTVDFNRHPELAAFGITIENTENEVDCRALPQPVLQYKTPQCLDTGMYQLSILQEETGVGNRGAWNLEGVVFYQGAVLKSWAVTSFAYNTQEIIEGRNSISEFMHGLMAMMRNMGMTVPTQMPPICDSDRMHPREALNNGILEAKAVFGEPPQILMVLLPNKDSWRYKDIKRAADGELGITTQCLVTSSAGIGAPIKGREQFMANLIQKINQKVGGKNCKLAGSLNSLFPVLGRGQNRPYIIFGADVTHPTSHDASEPSVGAVVASMDNELSTFYARPVILPHRQETLDMKDVIQELLRTFYQKNGVKPEAVFFYRDGVSDGQFESVLHHEYNEFHAAFAALNQNYSPPLTYIVVKKRHHMRLFPKGNDGDRNGNVQPGTVVDTGITSRYDFDFFLNSQAGIQGTNKAAHYYVLVDENGFGSDGLQLLTYWMCHLYVRCSRSVSYAPPAYYAHLAALRGKYLTTADSDLSSVEGQGGPDHLELRPALKEVMFFV